MKLSVIFSFLFLISFSSFGLSKNKIMIASYNVENFFDDQLKNGNWTYDDTAWTPAKGWTKEKFEEKAKRVAQAILDLNNGNTPEILGLVEIESELAIKEVNKNLGKKAYPYYGISEGPDGRGINVAILSQFPLCYENIKFQQIILKAPTESAYGRPTRPVIGATVCPSKDLPITVMVNHWPSRVGGLSQTEPLRKIAAEAVNAFREEYLKNDPHRTIVMLGDYNDEPEDKSIFDVLKALDPKDQKGDENLYNLDLTIANFKTSQKTPALQKSRGTFYFSQDKVWNTLDHMIVSGNVFDAKSRIQYLPGSFHSRPNPSFTNKNGEPITFVDKSMNVLTGLSDHLPIAAEFLIQ